MPAQALTIIMLWLPWCPPDCRLEDRDRFPPAAVCYSAECFWRARLCWLEHNRPLESWHQNEWREQIRQARWIYDVYDWCGAAQGNEGRDRDYWLYSLRRLRLLIWDEAYFAGVMP